MDKDELTAWALAHGWQMIGGTPCLVKPQGPKVASKEAIVRLVFKATVVSIEVKKPAGKWEKISGESYAKITLDPATGLPTGLGLTSIAGLTKLMQDNKDALVFAKMTKG